MEIFGIRWHTSVYVEVRQPIGFSSFSVRRSTLAYVVVRSVRRRFVCMHKNFRHMPTNGQYTERSFTERNSYGMFVPSTVTVRFQNGGIRRTNCGHTLTRFERISNVLVTYQERINSVHSTFS